MHDITAQGLRCTDFGGLDVRVAASDLVMSSDPAVLSDVDVVLVTVKTGASGAIAADVTAHVPDAVPVISLQNGLEAIGILRAALAGRDVRAGMVPFNVVAPGAGHYHRASSGDIVIGLGAGDLAQQLSVPGLRFEDSDDMGAVQWGKLLMNLSNAPNALSGLTVQEMLLDRRWRLLMAGQMQEAIGVLRAAGKQLKPPVPVPVGVLPFILRLPTPVFRRVASKMLTIDPTAKTSMAYDLDTGRKTEIDVLQSEIVRQAVAVGRTAPINARIAEWVRAVENGGDRPASPDDLRP